MHTYLACTRDDSYARPAICPSSAAVQSHLAGLQPHFRTNWLLCVKSLHSPATKAANQCSADTTSTQIFGALSLVWLFLSTMSASMTLRLASRLPQQASRSPTLTHCTSMPANRILLQRAPIASTSVLRSLATSTAYDNPPKINPQQEQQPLPSTDNQSTYSTNPPPAAEQSTGIADGKTSQQQQSQYKKRTIPRHCISTSHEIPPHRIVGVCGLVQGNTVRVRNVARDYFASVRAIFGGELTTYTDLLKEAREEAIQRMLDDAVSVGANGVVSMRITTSSIAANASELQA